MGGRIDFTMAFNNRRFVGHPKDSDNGYRIYVLGNFSGHPNDSEPQRKVNHLTLDNLEQVFAQLQPKLRLSDDLELTFTSLESFQPDQLLQSIPLLANLQTLKTQLNHPNTAEEAAKKIQNALSSQSNPASTPLSITAENTFEHLLNQGERPHHRTTDSFTRMVEQMVAPHIVQAVDPQHLNWVKVVEQTLGEWLGAILHHPDFQRLETLWTATATLLNTDYGDEQQFFVIDVSQAALASEVQHGTPALADILGSHLQNDDQQREVLLLADYSFGVSDEDQHLLAFCSQLARQVHGYFLAAAATDWQPLSPDIGVQAAHVMLAYPRYLARLPYGQKRQPIDAFDFEELADQPRHHELLWANPAFLVGRALIKYQQGDSPDTALFFGDTPCFSYDRDGESVLQPATEVPMTESQASALLAQNVVPVLSFKQRPGVRLMALVTLAES